MHCGLDGAHRDLHRSSASDWTAAVKAPHRALQTSHPSRVLHFWALDQNDDLARIVTGLEMEAIEALL